MEQGLSHAAKKWEMIFPSVYLVTILSSYIVLQITLYGHLKVDYNQFIIVAYFTQATV